MTEPMDLAVCGLWLSKWQASYNERLGGKTILKTNINIKTST